MPSKRKPYLRPMDRTWWQKVGYYRFYMLREGTAVASVWFSLLLIYTLASLKGGATAWIAFVELLANPLIVFFNIVALLAAVLHTITWFQLAPKAVNLPEKSVPLANKALWGITLMVSVIILALAICA